ncbi:Cof-type HAD-IIB family hydrolase [Pseudoramibacter alactolyticus]|jgi:Cof subfamily protein (haloacid dehalogenase superfamily)|uniref:Cof-type HAD-IIB family hydrolase n=1 Tax=Pseudoramibacter alactolyticus TaxID=113287 RepID=UPI00235533DC|nr:Cof-type HAD-IIB family hydrolase [Pseudoramibacter alactolyticus]MBM6969214.1 Cof-type HAD-IIB family hydrolase [Pseudoramibacter alactolyticus]
MRHKILFFDVDGTLVNFDRQLPASAAKALRAARAAGHRLILCTGRSRSQIYPFLKAFGFDGMVGAAGSHVILDGREVAHHTFGERRLAPLMAMLNEKDVPMLLQTARGGVLTPNAVTALGRFRLFQTDPARPLVAAIREAIGPMRIDPDRAAYAAHYGETECLVYCNAPMDHRAMDAALAPLGLTATPSSLEPADEHAGEITLRDVSKAAGMQELLTAMDVDVADTIAFGDGPNDLEMLAFAGIGVAMGNGVAAAKEAADMVTAGIDDDGLARAMAQLGLV